MKRRTLVDDASALLNALGVDHRRAGAELRCHCPSPDHAKKPGPGSVQVIPFGNRAGFWNCYSCGAGGGPIALVRLVLGIGGREARDYLRAFRRGDGALARVRPTWPSKSDPPRPRLRFPAGAVPVVPNRHPHTTAALVYLLGRHLAEGDVARWQIHALPEDAEAYAGRLVVPIVVDGEMVDFVARLYVPRDKLIPKVLSGRKSEGARKELSLWGFDELDPDHPEVTVVEGVWGAAAMKRAGIPNVVAACGSAWSPERTELLEAWESVVMMPDGDPAGSKLEQRASSLRFSHAVWMCDLPAKTQPDDHAPDVLRVLHATRRPMRPGKIAVPQVRLVDPDKS